MACVGLEEQDCDGVEPASAGERWVTFGWSREGTDFRETAELIVGGEKGRRWRVYGRAVLAALRPTGFVLQSWRGLPNSLCVLAL